MAIFEIRPVGDRALTVEFGAVIDEEINRRVHALAAWITSRRMPGITELVPTYRSLLICYDPDVLSYGRLKRRLERFDPSCISDGAEKRRILEVPCCYGGEFGPDLGDMESLTGLSAEEIVRVHSGVDYRIYMLGFLPGFVYLGGLDGRIEAPRLSSPRKAIPAGSVGIGGNQTGVYPMASPGGWRLIGRTPIPFYDPASAQPILCKAGEFIRFVPVSPEEYAKIGRSVADGSYRPKFIESEGGHGGCR